MAAPLGQTVFKVPELGKQGLALDQVREQRQEKKEAKRNVKLKSLGGDKVYNDNIYQLQGRFKSDADALYQKWLEAGENFKSTGDEKYLQVAQNASSQMKMVINDYQTQYGTALKARNEAEANGWVGYADNAESFQQKMDAAFGERPSVVGEDGRLFVIRDGKKVPYTESTDNSRSPINPYNSVIPAKQTKMGKYVLPQNFIKDNQNILIYAPEGEAVDLVVSKVTDNIEANPELASDIAMFRLLETGDIEDANRPPTLEDRKRAEEMFANNPEFREKAISSYVEAVRIQAEKGMKLRRQEDDYLSKWESKAQGGQSTAPEVTPEQATTNNASMMGGSQQSQQTAPSMQEGKNVPDWYISHLDKWEGGQSSDPDDNAYKANPDAPVNEKGERVHTNRGVQYNSFKSWASKNGIPKKEWSQRFLNLSDEDLNDIVGQYTKAAGADNFNEPVLRALFTQNAWGSGSAIRGSKSNSEDNQALITFLEDQIGREIKNSEIKKLSPTIAKEIEAAYQKDPAGFINEYKGAIERFYSTLDDFPKFGKGWLNRINDLVSISLGEIKSENSVNLQEDGLNLLG